MPHFPKPFFRKSRKTWYVEINGKQINLGKDKDLAFEKYHKLLASPDTAPEPQLESKLVVVICDNFLQWVQKHRSEATYGWYLQRLERFAEKYPNLTVDELKPYHVQQWIDQYDIAPTTQRNYIRSLKRAVAWAVQQGYIDKSPIEQMTAPSGERREDYHTEEEYEKILSAIANDAFRDLVIVSWDSGCRPQESLRVEARHFNAQTRTWIFPRSESKTKKQARIVYLTERATAICSRLAKTYPDGPLFRNANGEPWKNYAVQCAVRRVRVRLGKRIINQQGIEFSQDEILAKVATLAPFKTEKGIERDKTEAELRCEAKRKLTESLATQKAPKFCLYKLRHSFATRSLISGIDSLTVSQLMGHSDISTLGRCYAHLSNPKHLLRHLDSLSKKNEEKE